MSLSGKRYEKGKGIGGVESRWKNRIVGHDNVAVDQLLANPHNWRVHPKAQQDALAGAIEEVGYIRSVTVNQRTGHVIDGHLRIMLAMRQGVETIPVEYVDLSEEEELEALATLDPIAAMAVADKEKLDALLREVRSGDTAVQVMLAELAEEAGIVPPNVEFKEYDESVADEVEYITCPECGHKWPK